MKVLLINNHTDYLHNVVNALAGHEVEVQKYEPGLDFHWQGKDLIVLSGGGGEGYELKDKRGNKYWYEDEMNFVLTCNKPLVGICMGFEVISAAFGSRVTDLGSRVTGFHTHRVSPVGKKHLIHPKLKQYEHHQFAIPAVSEKHFEVMAYSDTGIEMIKHKQRKLIASQFHPEVKDGTIGLDHLIARVI
ncbi:MAG TPA: gamma-glutamyl-gamma-aminobutyrate hydrolase family protein [Candidatus Saccharimonadales bacterium]|nr:gamma-glutamyl-gamma-aminobutyrate hydrolase family protein [Candidatus Saccharimonadales bacterium]